MAALTDRLLSALDGGVCAVYLHGSAVLGGWRPGVSDVDVLTVLAPRLRPETAEILASVAVATVSACPGTGLELSAVTRAEAAAPQPPWRFVAQVAAMKLGERQVILDAAHPGDPDLLSHYAVCRAAGWPVFGPPAAAMIGAVPQPAVLGALAHELAWGLEQGSAPHCLLNACRALLYLQEQRLAAKTTGGRWAIDQGIGPSASIDRALAAQAGTAPAGIHRGRCRVRPDDRQSPVRSRARATRNWPLNPRMVCALGFINVTALDWLQGSVPIAEGPPDMIGSN